ncbi:hypothetical protein FOMPIDRAFT_149215 [Fomitopsis schrenkii]|uniref:EXS domain-containing protein n=1 Tax=Fomitopsis schrenkii TaxID=2126942 RepID=S8FV39_FOMSC|nr:hypothetical protein FOMPIDRAFT_149215 [Fomitopsis schrenkii]
MAGRDLPTELLFSAAFPLPFRVLSLAGLGILGWAINIHGLHLAGIDARSVLDLDSYDPRHARRTLAAGDRRGTGWKYFNSPVSIYRPVYSLFVAWAAWATTNWLLYRYATFADLDRVDTFKFIPAIASLVVTMVLISPSNVFQKAERDRFLHAIRRCLFPSARRVHFADVVFADVFTSFAKVLGDLWYSFWMLMPGGSLLVLPAQDGWRRWILPTLMSLPYLVRFRQCLIDYRAPGNTSARPLYNALKYATSFPVIYLSAAQRIVVSELRAVKGDVVVHQAWHGEHALFRLWLFAAIVNSLYSFWWDVTHDWGFDLLIPSSASEGVPHRPRRTSSPPRPLLLPSLQSPITILTPSPTLPVVDTSNDPLLAHERPHPGLRSALSWHPYGLRSRLLFPLPVYPFAIVADLVLRLTWSAKLSSHLHAYADGDLVIFCFELAEVVRRWMWVFLRVEWELVKDGRDGHVRSPPLGPTLGLGDEDYEMVASNQHKDGHGASGD